MLRDVRSIRPIPCTGRLGLWTPSGSADKRAAQMGKGLMNESEASIPAFWRTASEALQFDRISFALLAGARWLRGDPVSTSSAGLC